MANFEENLDFKFQFIFGAVVVCLVARLFTMLQFNESIGPLLKILDKMMNDFWNFFVIFVMLTMMFAVIGNINFLYTIEEYHGLFPSVLTVFDAAIGNYDFKVFDQIHSESQKLMG
jgi:hypothetical protein